MGPDLNCGPILKSLPQNHRPSACIKRCRKKWHLNCHVVVSTLPSRGNSRPELQIDPNMSTFTILDSLAPSILVADHESEIAEKVGEILKSQRYRTRTCTSGLDCLHLLHESLPTVLVVDLGIPWGGGDGVIECLSTQESCVSPLVIVTFSGQPRPLPERLLPWVDFQICRPESRTEIRPFASQLESLVWWSRNPSLERCLASPGLN